MKVYTIHLYSEYSIILQVFLKCCYSLIFQFVLSLSLFSFLSLSLSLSRKHLYPFLFFNSPLSLILSPKLFCFHSLIPPLSLSLSHKRFCFFFNFQRPLSLSLSLLLHCFTHADRYYHIGDHLYRI